MFANLLAYITGTERYRVDIKWFAGGIFHFLFRIPEFLFGRKFGIRPEMSSSVRYDENGKKIVTYTCYTWEALFCHAEGIFYLYLKNILAEAKNKIKTIRFNPQIFDIFDFSPKMAFAGFNYVPPNGEYPRGYSFAIALDTSTRVNQGATNTPVTWSHTTSGSNTIMFIEVAMVFSTSAPTINSLNTTYNSVAATGTIAKANDNNSFSGQGMTYLIAPSNGTNTVSAGATISTGNYLATGAAVTYSGVDQSSPIDGSNFLTGSNVINPITISVTVTAANCWLVGISENGNQTPTSYGGTQTVLLQSVQGYGVLVHSNKTVGTGTQTMVVNYASAAGSCWIGASFKPSTGSGPTGNSNFLGFFR